MRCCVPVIAGSFHSIHFRVFVSGSPPYLEPVNMGLNPRNVQPTFQACTQQCIDLAKSGRGCMFGTYISDGPRAKECWLSRRDDAYNPMVGR